MMFIVILMQAFSLFKRYLYDSIISFIINVILVVVFDNSFIVSLG